MLLLAKLSLLVGPSPTIYHSDLSRQTQASRNGASHRGAQLRSGTEVVLTYHFTSIPRGVEALEAGLQENLGYVRARVTGLHPLSHVSHKYGSYGSFTASMLAATQQCHVQKQAVSWYPPDRGVFFFTLGLTRP